MVRSRTRLERDQLKKVFIEELRNQYSDIISSDDLSLLDCETIESDYELGHHIKVCLSLTDKPSKELVPSGTEEEYWFVMVYRDDLKGGRHSYCIDLPGGKRYLGETALGGAIRETEEETSFRFGPNWVITSLQGERGPGKGSRFFCVRPSELILERVNMQSLTESIKSLKLHTGEK
mmetsp:Transcript_20356/g.40655  ORF Transcript_20356/g.40655 Transcript_20356/m.40655 type:complete len:177 (+) Transcript_20356:109-639(+)